MASFLKRSTVAAERLKQRLAQRDIVTLVHSSHPSASLVEKLADCRFDAVLIDCEHGSAGPRDVEDMARAANLTGIVSICRPERGLDWLITRSIECGVDGLMIPLVHTAEMARSVVDAVRFCDPFGHDKRIIIVMVESASAVANLDDILATDGIDAFLVAPGDLALSIGERPYTYTWQDQVRPQAVADLVDRAIAKIVSSGKPCGTLVSHQDVQDFVRKGVTLLYDHANHMLARGASEFHALVEASVAVQTREGEEGRQRNA